MGYVDYDLSLYRQGYRPYGETDPFAATMLSGVKPPSRGNVFGPARLRGLGQNQPFTESGGYKLHGLAGLAASFLGAAGIPNGSVLTYSGTWQTVFNTGAGISQPTDPQSIVNAVVDAINADGQLTVIQAPTSLSSSFSAVIHGLIGNSGSFPVTLGVQVTNGQGFASVNDIISIIHHYVYTVLGGVVPLQSITGSITQVNVPAGDVTSNAPNLQAAGLLNPAGIALPPGSPTLAPPGQPQTFTQWLAANGSLLAIAGLGVAAILVMRR